MRQSADVQKYLEAVDRAWNEYQKPLSVEQWGCSLGLHSDAILLLRRELEAWGIA